MLRQCIRHHLHLCRAATPSVHVDRSFAAGLSNSSTIEVTQQGSTAVIELNRPKQMNALSTEVRPFLCFFYADQRIACSRYMDH